jgi:repressor LexA
MTNTLTNKQNQVYEYIKARIESDSQAPTLSEIATEIGATSIRSVTQYLEALERKNLIQRSRYAQRGIVLTDNKIGDQELISVPVFASAGCGNPSIIAERTFDEYVTVAANVMKGHGDNLFIVKATGGSMVDAGIPDGSFVLVKMTDQVVSGDLVVAVVDDSAVIKKLSFANNVVILSPVSSNPSYQPIIIMERDFKVFGKVLRVIKVDLAEDDYQIVPLEQPEA